jgi:RING finger protein 121
MIKLTGLRGVTISSLSTVLCGKKYVLIFKKEWVGLMFPRGQQTFYNIGPQLLDWLRWLVCWQPIILMIVQFINWALGLE